MVRTAGPCLSFDASGSIGGAVTFSKWKGRNYARALVTPANPKSGGQTGIRSMFKFLTQLWASLTAGNQATWEDRAAQTAISPFNAFVSYNMRRWRNFLGVSIEDPADPNASTGTLGTLAATGGVRQITVTQPVTVAGNLLAIAFFRSTSGVFDSVLSNCVAVLPIDGTNDVVFVDTPLAAGTYYYECREITTDGQLEAAGAEVNATAT
jgi:hypothetical protein